MTTLKKLQAEYDAIGKEIASARRLAGNCDGIEEEGEALVRDGLLSREQFNDDMLALARHMRQLRNLEVLHAQVGKKLHKAKNKFTLRA